jgi:tetratricopeptide (TPR) repeat protein
LKAVILEETGREGQAEQHYEKSGNRFTLWFRLAAQLEETDPQRALVYYERVSGHDAQNNLLWFDLGNLYEKMGRPEDAGKCFRKMQLLREVLSRIVIPLGFMIIMATGSVMMIRRGDKALASVVIASAVFCVFWLKRDGGKVVQMIRKKNKYGSSG